MRCALFAAGVLALVAPTSRSAAPDLTGNWVLASVLPTGDNAVCILAVEAKDGKPTATVKANRANVETTISDFRATDKDVSFTVKMVTTLPNGQKGTSTQTFTGMIGADPKQILGSYGLEVRPGRGKLTMTDKTELNAKELVTKTPANEAYLKATQVQQRPLQLQAQAQQTKDEEKRKELMAQLPAARKEVAEKLPGLFREMIAQHPDTVPAADAAMSLLQLTTTKIDAAEGAKLVALIQKQAAPFGPRYVKTATTQLADAVTPRKELGAIAVGIVGPLAKALTDADRPADQLKVLALYQTALENAGMAAEAKGIGERIAKIDDKLDAEYLAGMPFKPTASAGRKDKAANRVAFMELFTGAQCPPCVAADIAFDALLKTYKPTDVVMVQHHMHIPGPDPMTNPDTVARWDYYREKFPEGMRGVPSSVFNGKPAGGGGGGMANAEAKYGAYQKIINPLLEESAPVKIGGKAVRTGDKVAITVEADGLEPSDDLKVRLLLVEDTVKFAGSNGIRFHHHVVRGMPGGAAGFAVKDKAFKQTASADLADIRKGLTTYLDDYAANTRPFPQPGRPMDMKDLKVIAIVQNDKTGEILQAGQIEVEGKAAGGSR